MSVIIPAYNSGRLIRMTIESVLAQTYRDFELIIVDDGSTDDTAEVIRSYGAHARGVSQPNQGVASARNTGFLNARGDILCFLDSDDLWEPLFLESLTAALAERPDTDVVFAWGGYADEHGTPLPGTIRPTVSGDVLRRALVEGCFVVFSMMAVRRRCFEKVGLFDPALSGPDDWDMLIRLAAAGVRFACVPRLLMHKRLHAANLSKDLDRRGAAGFLAVLEKAFQTLPPAYRVLEAQARSRVLLRAGVRYCRAGVRDKGVRYLVEGFACRPDALGESGTYARLLLDLLPPGYRTDGELLRRGEDLYRQATAMLDQALGQHDLPAAVQRRSRLARANFHAVFSRLLWRGHRRRQAARHAWRSVMLHPGPVLRGAVSVLYSRRQAPVAQRIERLASNQ